MLLYLLSWSYLGGCYDFMYSLGACICSFSISRLFPFIYSACLNDFWISNIFGCWLSLSIILFLFWNKLLFCFLSYLNIIGFLADTRMFGFYYSSAILNFYLLLSKFFYNYLERSYILGPLALELLITPIW